MIYPTRSNRNTMLRFIHNKQALPAVNISIKKLNKFNNEANREKLKGKSHIYLIISSSNAYKSHNT